ncbi:MAG: hypothetical protein J7502_03390 [Flavisolibacter sp.]|nr:hypothetical protein [Flavisolibacter sp.]
MSIDNFLTRRTKKITLNFPSEAEMWRFFETSDVREFRLDSSNCTVSGRFLPIEIERAQTQMNAVIKEVNCN